MPKQNESILSFNRGIVDPRALSRIDIDRIRNSAEQQTNWLPSIMGSMTVRPGTEYKIETESNLKARTIPFVFSAQDNAALEFTPGYFRVLNDSVPLERPTVSSTITNTSFTSSLTGWTDDSASGASTAHSTEYSGSLRLQGALNGDIAAIYQQITVAPSDLNIEHGIRINIPHGPVTVKIGSTSTGSEYFLGSNIQDGYISISIVPTGDFYIRFESDVRYYVYVADVSIESGIALLPTPYSTDDLIKSLRYEQSADVVYLSNLNIQPRKIIRRASRTWSVEAYKPIDGPFRAENISPITMSLSGTIGTITITSSVDYFNSSMEGALMRITPGGQNISISISSEDTFSDAIEVTGVGTSRSFTIKLTGTWVATVTLQRSYDGGATWEDTTTSYTGNVNTPYQDNLDNVDILYRLGVKTGDYTSGTVNISTSYPRGGVVGYLRIKDYVSATSVVADVLKSPTSVSATENWAEGAFSTYRGFPSSVVLHEGRLFFDLGVQYYASIAEAYESFDENIEGDSGVISKTIGSGPVDSIYWLLSLNRLLLGTSGGQKELRSSSLDEPLTPNDSSIKQPSSIPSSNVPAIKVDINGMFISGQKIYELYFDSESFGYIARDLTVLCPNIANGSFIHLAVSRMPETRVHCVRSDGKVAILCYSPEENLKGWVLYETDGIVEDVYVLPNADDEQDDIFYVVKRTINGVTKRYHEKWSLESECIGGIVNKNLDCHINYNNSSPLSTITGLSHLEGETVYVWGNNKDLGTFTVSSGQITLPEAATYVVVGLGYTAKYKTTKLAYAAGLGTPLTQRKMVNHIGLNLYKSHINGLQYGRDFENLDDIPLIVDGEIQDENKILDSYDQDMVSFAGVYNTDARLCLQSVPNRPCTVTAIVLGVSTHDKG